jgi:hypothetical protein
MEIADTSKPTEKRTIEAALERMILHGLRCEWEEALGFLNCHDKEHMRRPLFGLRDMKRRWGYWSASKREICLSKTLVRQHPWDAVKEVLLHEMAHQFASEVLQADDEPPHGPSFEKACFHLRANPKASGTYPLLDERLAGVPGNVRDKMMDRIKKLLALAESKNLYEAEAAMAKAHQLIAKHHLDLIKNERYREYVSAFAGRPALRHSRDVYLLASLLQDFYCVHAIWVPAYVIEKGKMGRVLELSGTTENVKLAGYVHTFVSRFIESEWCNYHVARSLNRYQRTDYAVGILEGFRSKLQRTCRRKSDPQTELAVTKGQDPLLKHYIAYRYPHIRRLKTKGNGYDARIFRDGERAGQQIVISRPIKERSGSIKRLLAESFSG